MLKLKSVNFEQRQFENHQIAEPRAGQLEWLIGRSSTCDLILPTPEVSRVHGRIVYANNAYYFVDEGSTSGSLLNGEPIPAKDKRLLQPGDLLQLGETFLYIEETTPPLIAAAGVPITCPPLSYPDQPWLDQDLICRCCRIIDETPDVKTFYFVAEPPVLFHYKPGQFANLEVEIDGKVIVRSYSISSTPTRPYHLSITIKRVPSPPDQPDVPPGLVSNWMHDHLKVGDQIKLLGGAMGQFTCLPHLPSKLLLISAGSGITPMMSMSRWVQDALAESDIIFLHSARTPDDIIFRAELEAMAAQLPNFHLAVTLTQPPAGRAWFGLTGRISQAMLHWVAPDILERSVFVCGPEPFMQSVKSIFETMQFPMQNYQQESFGGRKKTTAKPKPTVAPSGNQPAMSAAVAAPSVIPPSVIATGNNGANNGTGHATPVTTPPAAASAAPMIHFAKSGQSVPTDGSTTLLELAEQEGISIRSACRAGACGACKVLTRQGKVRYETPPTALSAADQEAGYVLACVAQPIDQLVVEA
jgi:ferredoxin-NADP reductase/ferredoxin